MMISTKGRYALRVMIDLAEHQTGEYIPLKAIAQRQGISEKIFGEYFEGSGAGKPADRRAGQGRRVPADPGTGDLHRGRDSEADRGEPCTGGMRRG